MSSFSTRLGNVPSSWFFDRSPSFFQNFCCQADQKEPLLPRAEEAILCRTTALSSKTIEGAQFVGAARALLTAFALHFIERTDRTHCSITR
jgi:hypothetical protein